MNANGFESALHQLGELVGIHRHMELGVIRASHFQRFASASNDLNARYLDDEQARAEGFASAVAPPMFLTAVLGWSYGPPTSLLRADGADTSLLDNGFGLAGLRLMGGGQDVEFFEDITDGMQIDVTSGVEAVELKHGTTGPLLIITLLSSYTDGRARLVCRCRETLIAR
jgi:hypothetical protein